MPLSRIAGEGGERSEPGEGLNPMEMPTERARELRRDATDVERRLWSALRDRRLRGYRFRRQHPIGDFIVDFACTRHCLIVEADGGQHADNAADRAARPGSRLRGGGYCVFGTMTSSGIRRV